MVLLPLLVVLLVGGVGRDSGGLRKRNNGFWLRLDVPSVVAANAAVVSVSSSVTSVGLSVTCVVKLFSSSSPLADGCVTALLLGKRFKPDANVGLILYLDELERDTTGALDPADVLKPPPPLREDVGWILDEVRPRPNDELPPPPAALLDFGRENLREPDAVGAMALLALLLLPPNLFGFDAGTAVTVGVKSLLVMVVALPGPPFLRLGANVGLGLDTNGRMTGVKVRFLVWKVRRDLVRLLSSSSSSSSPSSSPSFNSVVVSSSVLVLSVSEPSMTTGDGEMGMSVALIAWSGACVGVGVIALAGDGWIVCGLPTMKLDVLSIIWAYRPSMTVPKTLDWYKVVVSFCTIEPSINRTKPVLWATGVSVAKDDCLSKSTSRELVLSMT